MIPIAVVLAAASGLAAIQKQDEQRKKLQKQRQESAKDLYIDSLLNRARKFGGDTSIGDVTNSKRKMDRSYDDAFKELDQQGLDYGDGLKLLGAASGGIGDAVGGIGDSLGDIFGGNAAGAAYEGGPLYGGRPGDEELLDPWATPRSRRRF